MTGQNEPPESKPTYQHLCPDHGWEFCSHGDPDAPFHACIEGGNNTKGRMIESSLPIRLWPPRAVKKRAAQARSEQQDDRYDGDPDTAGKWMDDPEESPGE